MPRIRFKFGPRIGLLFLTALPAGCAHMDPVGGSALVGSGLGAATGAIIGHQSGDAGAGAVIGAAAGALGGALVGDAEQSRRERDAAFAYADAQAYQHAANAVTNSDVIFMTQSGLSDDVIINAIHTRGGRFDTSPQALTTLHTSGVSNAVISAMQNAGVAPLPAYAPAPPPPPIVVVEPPPPPLFIGRFGRHHHHHCRPFRPRSGIHIHGSF